jgi:hypothetical protein
VLEEDQNAIPRVSSVTAATVVLRGRSCQPPKLCYKENASKRIQEQGNGERKKPSPAVKCVTKQVLEMFRLKNHNLDSVKHMMK